MIMRVPYSFLRSLARPLGLASHASLGDGIRVPLRANRNFAFKLDTPEKADEWKEHNVPLLAMLTDRGPRFYRECYVDADGVSWCRSEGMMDYAHIFTEANAARWTIVRDNDHNFILIDLWETTAAGPDITSIYVGTKTYFRDIDAAIAAACLKS